MRKSLTPQEARLWVQLRALRSQGFHFRRQAPFKGYFLDFVCFKSRLVIEVDGGGHGDDAQSEHDQIRDTILKRVGFDTLRVWNNQINTNLDGVMIDILAALDPLPPSPSWGGPTRVASGVGESRSTPHSRADPTSRPFGAARLDPPDKGEGGH